MRGVKPLQPWRPALTLALCLCACPPSGTAALKPAAVLDDLRTLGDALPSQEVKQTLLIRDVMRSDGSVSVYRGEGREGGVAHV